ncbi:hypothetical protein RCL_jg5916.t1 [Rhizophagus clarus]|uniref:Uncharacterized protein n=1 Tax=Rhizophagus clarus TaxID=94130 RepID=A0A8H3M0H0_9GLOM|nr:hypothetical protein RCL_jg5916.t1 [Rhizophagus clarus]
MSGDVSDRYERLNPLMAVSWNNFSISSSSNSTSAVLLFVSLHLLTSGSETAKRRFFAISDSSLDGR